MSLSTGLLYFLKYTFLALLLWYVYYVARAVMASLKSASEIGRLALDRHHQEQRGFNERQASPVNTGRGISVAESSFTSAERPSVTFAGAFAPGRAGSSSESWPVCGVSEEMDGDSEVIVSDSVDMEQTIAKKPRGWGWGRRSGSKAEPARKLLVEEAPVEDASTCASMKAVIDSWGFVEVLSGVDSKIKRLPVEKGGILLGRAKDCTLRVIDGFASSHHARVIGDRDGVYLQDLDSRNGTFLDGERVEGKVALNDGDTFAIGDATFRYSRY